METKDFIVGPIHPTRNYPELKKINKMNPEERPADANDQWFKENVDLLAKDKNALAYIEDYRFLQKTMIPLLENPLDPDLQKLLVSVYYDEDWGYQPNFPNLLTNYLHIHDLLPQIKSIITTNGCFKQVLQIYKKVRG